MKSKRYVLLDSIRGITLISMMIYHAVWDIVYIFGADWAWYESELAHIWQQSICWCFILLSGFCWSLGSKKLKRALTVLVAGCLVSVVTLIFMPRQAIMYGVLTLLGSCMLFMIPLDKVLKKCHPVWGAVLSFSVFILFKKVNRGILSIGSLELMRLPDSLYANSFTTYLGFTAPGFRSTDYFSMLPWFFLFLTGYFIYGIVEKQELLKYLKGWKSVVTAWIGRHSLLIYMLHQPVIYAVLFVVFRVL